MISSKGLFLAEKQVSLVSYIISINGKKKLSHVSILRKFHERPAQLEGIFSDVSETETQAANFVVITLSDDSEKTDKLPNTIVFSFSETKGNI